MFTTTLAAIATFQVVFFSKHDITLFSFVKILRVQFFFEHLLLIWLNKGRDHTELYLIRIM